MATTMVNPTSTPTSNLGLEMQSSEQYYNIAIVNNNLRDVDDAFGRNCIVISYSGISSLGENGLPFTNTKITKSHRVMNMVLSNPGAQSGDWTYDVIDGKFTLKGAMSGTTNITIFLAEVYGTNAATNAKINSCFNAEVFNKYSPKVFTSDTLANIESALATYGGTMNNDEFKNIRFGVTSATGLFSATAYYGTMKRYSATRLIVTVQSASYSDVIISGIYNSGTWTWSQSDHSVSFGDLTKTLETVLTENWQTAILNARPYPTPVTVQADNTNYYGSLSRYSTRYGSGVLTRYDGKVYACFMSNSTVTVRCITDDLISEFLGSMVKKSTDLNNETTIGVVRYDSDTSNKPQTPGNNPYGVCFTIGTNTNTANVAWFFQIAMSTADNNLYTRSKINTYNWTNWGTIRSDSITVCLPAITNITINGSPSSAATTTIPYPSGHIPPGYGVWGVNVLLKAQGGSNYYQLPYINNSMSEFTVVERVANNAVVLNSKTTWTNNKVDAWITLYCRKN